MANVLYPKGREGFLDGSIDWDTHTIKGFLVDSDYTYNAAHDNVDDVATAGMIGGNTSGLPTTAVTLASKTVTDGVADAADLVFTAVTNATNAVAVILYKDTGTASTSRLIAYIDTATGLPATPAGTDITVAWDNGANKIFKL